MKLNMKSHLRIDDHLYFDVPLITVTRAIAVAHFKKFNFKTCLDRLILCVFNFRIETFLVVEANLTFTFCAFLDVTMTGSEMITEKKDVTIFTSV